MKKATVTNDKVQTVSKTKKEIISIPPTLIEVVEVKKSNIDRKFETLTKLQEKENKSVFDYVKLANVTDYIADKSVSKIYKYVTESEYAQNILGNSDIPSFNEFRDKLPSDKKLFSRFDGYKNLAKFNIANELSKKVAKQNKKIAAK